MDLNEHDFDKLRGHIRKLCGLHIQDEKKYLVNQRLEPLVRDCGCEDFSSFRRLLEENPNRELNEKIIACITTNETSFFRDRHPFETFRDRFLPDMGRRIRMAKGDGSPVRISIWSAAASTGQEPYTLAMLVSGYLKANSYLNINADDFNILATDISDKVLAQARAGVYNQIEVSRGLEEKTRDEYFIKEGKHWRVKENVASLVRFQRLNLTESFSLLPVFDAIFCRNVLIYFDEETRNNILHRFHGKLIEGGLLFLGVSENLYAVDGDLFDSEVIGKTVVYRKK